VSFFFFPVPGSTSLARTVKKKKEKKIITAEADFLFSHVSLPFPSLFFFPVTGWFLQIQK